MPAAPQGRWLPAERYQAPGRFTQVAAGVRAARRTPGFTRPLEEQLVAIHCTTNTASSGSGPQQQAAAAAGRLATAEHRAALQRLVRALGGRVCGVRGAGLVVVAGGGGRPADMAPGAAAVREEWLLLVAEAYEAPPKEPWLVGR
jgi:hypothetical protein